MKRTAATVALLAVVGVVAFGFAAAPASAQDDGTENETVVVEVTLAGATAENATVDDPERVSEQVAEELDVPAERVGVVEDGSTAIEVRTAGVSPEELADAIATTNASVERSDVRAGVTDQTRDRAARIIDGRLDATSEYNGSVVRVESERLYVQMTPEPTDAVLDRLLQRGDVTIRAETPDGETSQLVTNGDFRQVGQVFDAENFSVVAVRFTEDGASQFSSELRRLNVTSEGVDACEGSPATNASGYCLATSLNGEIISKAGVNQQLADAVEMGVFTENEQLGIVAGNETEARAFQLAVLSVPIQTDTEVASVESAEDAEIEQNWPPDTGDNNTANDTDNGTDGDETPTSTASPEPANGTDTESSGSSGPGFTPLVGLLAVVLAGLLALRRTR